MAQRDYSEHQQDIISKYYRNLDTIMLDKLQTLVSELYMAQTESRRNQLWRRVGQAMVKLGIPEPIMEHIMADRNVEVLARNLQDWLKHAGGKS